MPSSESKSEIGDDDCEGKATLEGQFSGFAKLFDSKRTGETITLNRSDYWMRQAKLLDDRKLKMTDTGLAFIKLCKTELNWYEWNNFLIDLCESLNLNEEVIKDTLTNCGTPGQYPVMVPMYRNYFLTWKRITYCKATYDNNLCWKPTPAGELSSQNCPESSMTDTQQLAFRRCGINGLWVGKTENEFTGGWTNYTSCFSTMAQELLKQLHGKEELQVANNTRILEIIGSCVSFIALAVSLIILCRFRSLYNNRTRIHKNLFGAMMQQVVLRLTIFLDQAIVWNVPNLCTTLYILLEYSINGTCMWMFIEGMYLHNVATTNSLRAKASFPVYYFIGWGSPVIVTGIWALLMNASSESNKCWYGYNFKKLYWLVLAPRIAVVVANFLFLLIILRDLIMKLRGRQSRNLQVTKKAARAALVLLPLLGLTDALSMIEPPLGGVVWKFALWSYTTCFLRSFQGFFLALIYCFMNQEVRSVIRKRLNDWIAMRENNLRRQRDSSYFFRSTALSTDSRPATYSARIQYENELCSMPQWIEMRGGQWSRQSSEEVPALPPRQETLPYQGSQKFDQKTENRPDQDHSRSVAITEVNPAEVVFEEVFLPADKAQYCNYRQARRSSYDTTDQNQDQAYSTNAINGSHEMFEQNHGVTPYKTSLPSLEFNFDLSP